MTVSTARGWVRQFARNGEDTVLYPPASIDRAIQAVGNRFCRKTRLIKPQRLQPDFDADDTGVQILTAGPPPIRPEHVISVLVKVGTADYVPLEFRDIDDVRGKPAADRGTPQWGAFGSTDVAATALEWWPIPDTGGDALVRYWQGFTTWTPGDAGADATVLNIPDEYLSEILATGAPVRLQYKEPEHKLLTVPGWKDYLAFEAEIALACSSALNVHSAERDMSE